MLTGNIFNFDTKKKFGFIETADEGDRVFFHIGCFDRKLGWIDSSTITVGRAVEFELELQPDGRHRAKNIVFVDAPPTQH